MIMVKQLLQNKFSDPYINKARIYSEKGSLQDYDAAIENYSHYLKIHQTILNFI